MNSVVIRPRNKKPVRVKFSDALKKEISADENLFFWPEHNCLARVTTDGNGKKVETTSDVGSTFNDCIFRVSGKSFHETFFGEKLFYKDAEIFIKGARATFVWEKEKISQTALLINHRWVTIEDAITIATQLRAEAQSIESLAFATLQTVHSMVGS